MVCLHYEYMYAETWFKYHNDGVMWPYNAWKWSPVKIITTLTFTAHQFAANATSDALTERYTHTAPMAESVAVLHVETALGKTN